MLIHTDVLIKKYMKNLNRIYTLNKLRKIFSMLIVLMILGCNLLVSDHSEKDHLTDLDFINYFNLKLIDSNIHYSKDYTFFINDTIVLSSFLDGPPTDENGNHVLLKQMLLLSSLKDTSNKLVWNFAPYTSSVVRFFAYDEEFAYGYDFVSYGLVKVAHKKDYQTIAPLSLPEFLLTSGDYVIFVDDEGKKLFNYKSGELLWKWPLRKSSFELAIIENYLIKSEIERSKENDGYVITIACVDLKTKNKIWERKYSRNKSEGIIVSPDFTFVDANIQTDGIKHVIFQTLKTIDFIDVSSNRMNFQIQKNVEGFAKTNVNISYPYVYYSINDSLKCFNIKTKEHEWSKKINLNVERIELWREHLLFVSKDSLYVAPLKSREIDKVFPISFLYDIRRNNYSKCIVINKKIYN